MTGREGELTTPTGAALLKTLSSGFAETFSMRVEKVGYGAGNRTDGELPDLLRVLLGKASGGEGEGRVYIVEANIDDMDPQIYTYLFERLMGGGALDVYLTPVQMKKGRPGVLVTVLAEESALEKVTSIMLSETTTIGLRYWETGRRTAERRIIEVETSLGVVRVKEVEVPGRGVRRKVEFDDLVELARKTGGSIVDIQRKLMNELDLTRD